VVECAITRPAQTKDTAANFAVSIKTEALSSGLGRTDSAWSSARHVITTRVMMVPASPAPRRAAGAGRRWQRRSSKKWQATFGDVLWGARFVALVGKSKGQSSG